MICSAVSVGVVIRDVTVAGVAVNAGSVLLVLGGVAAGAVVASAAFEMVQAKKIADDLATEAISSVILNRQALSKHKLMQRLERAGVAQAFADADVIMETKAETVIGFRSDGDGGYQVSAKWGGPAHLDETARLTQQYARIKVKREFEARGYQVIAEEELPDQTIRVVVRQWG
jgi:hypothetical protein